MSTVYHVDDDGREVSYDCLHYCAPGQPAACDRRWCRCQCHQPIPDVDPQRAAQLDDRPADKLAAIAADMEREQYGSLRDLTAERFGRPTRGAA